MNRKEWMRWAEEQDRRVATRFGTVLDVLDVVFLGIHIALPLAMAAYLASATGQLAAGAVILVPAICGYYVGRKRSLAKWQVDFDARVERLRKLEEWRNGK